MNPCFQIVQLIGGNFDIESETLKAFPQGEHGVALFFSGCSLHVPIVQVRHWCELVRKANGAPVDCLVWHGEGENRRPIGGARMRWLEIGN